MILAVQRLLSYFCVQWALGRRSPQSPKDALH